MKISPQQVQLITKLYREHKLEGPREAKATPGKSGDKVTISKASQEMQIAKQRLADMADIRRDKVAELKVAIEEGTYQVSARDIAEKFLARAAVDRMLEEDL